MSSENSLSDPDQTEHGEVALEQQEVDEKINQENEFKEDSMKKEEIKKMEIEQSESDKSVGTYIFQGEDHTFGNAIREMLVMQKDVDFVGYTIPHPSENKIHLRLQVKNQKNANTILKAGLKNLVNVCDVINEKFEKALVDFNQQENKPQKQKKSKKVQKKE